MNKVLPGQPQKMSASTFNTFVDAANDYQRRKMGQRAGIGRPDTKPGILTVRNLSGVDLDRFAVVGISDVTIKPEENFDEFCSRPTLDIVTPTADHAGKFAILQEPIAAGGLGLAMVSGTSPVVLKRASGESSQSAGVLPYFYCLKAGETGAQVIWESAYVDENDNRAAIVRFPYGGSSGGTGNATVRVASTANIEPLQATDTTLTLDSAPSIDGITPAIDDRVLLKNQTASSQNGIYKVGADNVWTRENDTLYVVAVQVGTINGKLWFVRSGNSYSAMGAVYG